MSNGMNISFRVSAIDDFSATMRNLESSTQKAFKSIGTVGKSLSVVGATIGGALGLAAKSAIDFEKQLSNVKAVSGASGKEMAQLTKLAQELGAQTKYGKCFTAA